MTRQLLRGLAVAALVLGLSANTHAGMIAHYNFTDGDLFDNEVGASYTLTEEQSGTGSVVLDPVGFAHFAGNDVGVGNQAFLKTTGPGGKPNFTVSFWFRTDSFDQGDYQGLFSNAESSTGTYSWQIDNHGADMRLVSIAASANPVLTYPESNLSTDTWYHAVLRKEDGAGLDYTQVYITAEGEATANKVMNQNANPGGLQFFRLGANRNGDNLFRMDMANVKIFDDSTVDLDALLAEGPSLVPEPSTFVLAALGLIGLLAVGRRRKRC